MSAGKYNFIIEQGATLNFEIAYKDSASVPIDLTDHQARMQIRPSLGSSEVYLTLSSSLNSCGSGLNMSGSAGINPPSSGTIGIYISSISSSLLNFDKAVYDLEISSGSGNCAYVSRILEGGVQLSQNVTLGNF